MWRCRLAARLWRTGVLHGRLVACACIRHRQLVACEPGRMLHGQLAARLWRTGVLHGRLVACACIRHRQLVACEPGRMLHGQLAARLWRTGVLHGRLVAWARIRHRQLVACEPGRMLHGQLMARLLWAGMRSGLRNGGTGGFGRNHPGAFECARGRCRGDCGSPMIDRCEERTVLARCENVLLLHRRRRDMCFSCRRKLLRRWPRRNAACAAIVADIADIVIHGNISNVSVCNIRVANVVDRTIIEESSIVPVSSRVT
jgi:hypothetical protein